MKALPTLSCLMKDGISATYTHADHLALANRLYASYARSIQTYIPCDRTERRARALEAVLIPEMDEVIAASDVRLERLDQEEAIRTRGLQAQPAGII